MNLSVGAKTDPGRRPNNEDQLLVLDVRRHGLRADGVLVIADGMGGRNFGERASAAAVETVGEALSEMLDAGRDPGVDVGDALDSALRKANSRVYDLAGSDTESQGMGTTCVAAVVEGERVFVAHVGDSRAYRLRAGRLEQLTDDHSYVAEQVRAGVLTEENARRSRFRNVITRAVGIEPTITPDVREHDVQTGDTLLLCTDGLTNMVPEEEIAQAMGQAQTAQAAADRLVQMANANGGRDNITAVVARLEVGTRTQRMRAGDLAQIVQPKEAAGAVDDGAAPPTPDATPRDSRPPVAWQAVGAATGTEEDETPTVQSAYPSPAPVALSPAPAPETDPVPRRARSGRAGVFGVSLLALIAAGLLAATLGLGRIVTHEGYHFQAAPPFAVKPPPPPPPRPPDLAHVAYGAPALLSAVPVSGDLLARSPADGTLTVLSLSGSTLALGPDGGTRFKFPLPPRHLSGAATAAPATAPASRLHTASDAQGDLYLSDGVLRSIEKYTKNGEFLRAVGAGALKQPQALAVGADGTIYVVDAQRLKVIPATPAPQK